MHVRRPLWFIQFTIEVVNRYTTVNLNTKRKTRVLLNKVILYRPGQASLVNTHTRAPTHGPNGRFRRGC